MLNELTIKEAHEGLKNKKFTSVELTEACLARIENNNSKINAFITVSKEYALKSAKRADKMIAEGAGGVLTGIPFCVKDSICTEDVLSTGAAKILDNYIAPYDATVIRKLKEKGAVLLGKNNCDAFGHGASNENSMYGVVKNPYDISKVPGGSSGGSASAVADNMTIFAIAEDTGGSIRQPASFCGIVGLRPSYGRNSRYGIMPMASSLDTVGPMTKTVEDMAIVMEEIAGQDKKDSTTVSDAVPNYSEELSKDITGLTVGVPKEYFETKGLDKEVAKNVEEQIEKLKTLGCKIKEVSLPHTKYAIAVYYITVPSEDSSNLGRLDGIRYGVRLGEGSLYNLYGHSRGRGFPDEVKRRIMMGTYALSAGYYDAYYRKAQKVRTLIIQDFERAFGVVDIIIAPTSPFPAFGLGEKSKDIMAMYLSDVFVSPSAVAGIPAISIPTGTTKSGLPIGTQLIGPSLGEVVLMRTANSLLN
jgi:aspartyl-tRNA(Asn)/glutamyl-tRNA(Gln) amidotransferase subunit A